MICRHYNKDINSRLVPDPMAASVLGMVHFPDQSQATLLLRRMDEANLGELEEVHAEHLRHYQYRFHTFHRVGRASVGVDRPHTAQAEDGGLG